MPWYPQGHKRPISVNHTRAASVRDCIVLHSTGDAAASQFSWFNNPSAQASSHFHVAKNGVVEQYVDTAHSSWRTYQANARAITIETQGLMSDPWTEQQMRAMASLIKWLSYSYRIPIRKMKTSDDVGIGWHRIGIDGSFPDGALSGREKRGGEEAWSKTTSLCPGDARILQVDRLLVMVRGRDTDAAPVENTISNDTTSTDPSLIDGGGAASIISTAGGGYGHLNPSATIAHQTHVSTITTN